MNGLDPHNYTLIVVALITGVLSPIIIQFTRWLFVILNKKEDNKCDISRNIEIENSITTKLERIREFFNADRVWIAEFHNGGHTFTGKSLQKFSETYEVVGKGISREGTNTQNIPTSLFSSFFKTIIEDGVYLTRDTIEDEINNIFKGFFEARGIKAFSASVIKNLNGNAIGVLCVDKVTSSESITQVQLEQLKNDASIIAGYLETFFNKR